VFYLLKEVVHPKIVILKSLFILILFQMSMIFFCETKKKKRNFEKIAVWLQPIYFEISFSVFRRQRKSGYNVKFE